MYAKCFHLCVSDSHTALSMCAFNEVISGGGIERANNLLHIWWDTRLEHAMCVFVCMCVAFLNSVLYSTSI